MRPVGSFNFADTAIGWIDLADHRVTNHRIGVEIIVSGEQIGLRIKRERQLLVVWTYHADYPLLLPVDFILAHPA